MNWLDGVILAIIVWFTLTAFSTGFIREIVTIITAILGVILAGLFYKDLAEDVLVFVDSQRLAWTLAFLGIFGATFIAGQLIALLMKETVSFFQLGVFDSLAGAAFGFVKGLVIIEVLLIFFATYPSLGLGNAIDDSAFTPIFVDKAPILLRVLPTEFDAAQQIF